jgi:arylsulfatase A-like enzyme
MRAGQVGVFIASFGNRDGTGGGLSQTYYQAFFDHVRLEISHAADSDGDGLPDAWETLYFGSTTAADPAANPDHDDLTNLQEFQLGTHPTDPDTDGDTLPDGAEVNGTLNPWTGGVQGSPPGDPTDPLKADSDGDGFRDDIEIANGSDPNNPASPRRPNILFILADDLGWTDLRTGPSGPNTIGGRNFGSDYYQTPNLSRLADEGLSFTNCRVCVNCCPTRAALLSGQYAPRSGNGVYVVDNLNRGDGTPSLVAPGQNEDVPAVTVTYPEALKAAGYITAHFGKYHVGGHEGGSATLPLNQGFTFNFGGNAAGAPAIFYASAGKFASNIGRGLDPWAANYTQNYLDTLLKGPPANPLNQRAANPNNPDLIPGNPLHGSNKHLTDGIADAVIEFIDDHRGGPAAARPFLINLHFFAVHTPIQPRYDLRQKYNALPAGTRHGNPAYAALVEGLDQSLGRILDHLDDPNGDGDPADSLSADTLVVFTSDNGGHIGDTDNDPLRDRKGSLYEGGIRVPLIVRRPGTVPAGVQSDTLVHAVDFYPTLVEHAGANLPPGAAPDGVSFDAHLRDPSAHPRHRGPVFWHFPGYLDTRARPCSVVIKRIGGTDYKLIHSYDTQYTGNNPPAEGLKVLASPWELYDLTNDIGETRNLADGGYSHHLLYGAIADELAAELHGWLTQGTADWNPKQPTYRSSGAVVPLAPASVPDVIVPFAQAFHLTRVATGPGPDQVTLTWNSEAGFHYDIEGSADLSEWRTLATGIAAIGAATTHAAADPRPPGARARFYRVRLRL